MNHLLLAIIEPIDPGRNPPGCMLVTAAGAVLLGGTRCSEAHVNSMPTARWGFGCPCPTARFATSPNATRVLSCRKHLSFVVRLLHMSELAPGSGIRRQPGQSLPLDGSSRHAPKKRKVVHRLPPAKFWDNVSEIHQESNTLAELNRRGSSAPSPSARKASVCRLVCHEIPAHSATGGGPDLSGLRGVWNTCHACSGADIFRQYRAQRGTSSSHSTYPATIALQKEHCNDHDY